MSNMQHTHEGKRLAENREGWQKRDKTKYWQRWGLYVSDRQWGTVREDYSWDGNAWDYFPHDQARSRAYRWGEDGIAGISDNHQRLCFAIALWNGEDDILKERLFGLTNGEGNHGEDVKEYYFYLDNTPTHSYMKCLYKYPQSAFPYTWLVEENRRRKATDAEAPEFELIDTGVFNDDHYFDVFVEYAKNLPEDILIQISVINLSVEQKVLHLLPTLWFRNTWSWGNTEIEKPHLKGIPSDPAFRVVEAYNADRDFGKRWLYCEKPDELLYTENETNKERFGWGMNASRYVKDGINDYIVHGRQEAINPYQEGTKASAHYTLAIGAGETTIVRLRLSDQGDLAAPFGTDFDSVLQDRKREADEFYQTVTPFPLSEKFTEDMRRVQRQAFAGMLWSKQFYYYVVQEWLNGDPAGPPPPSGRKNGRNHEWIHLYNEDIISMPDKWEYPWFAAWDLAFHTISLALVDPDFAKSQLRLFPQDWYMHPNGQLPAYEWAFDDVNPPVHAWAAWRVYKIEQKMYGYADREFLEEMFQKLALYFTWWVNRKDAEGNNLFGGGFLGLDNIGVFDRSHLQIPGASIEQSDGTSWMGMYCLNMLKIATELAKADAAYETMATKFFQHFLLIAHALNHVGGDVNIWNEEDHFYYDFLKIPKNALTDGSNPSLISMKVRSMVGLIPLFAIEAIEQETLDALLSVFKPRYEWFMKHWSDFTQHDNIFVMNTQSQFMQGTLLSLVNPERLRLILEKMLNEEEFLSPYGIRALSKCHAPDRHPYRLPFPVKTADNEYIQPDVKYEPAESSNGLFGGNSNWRGPVWFPVNFLIIESLQKFHRYLGDDFKVACPTGSGTMMTLWEVATELSHRLIQIFLQDTSHGQRRPVYGGTEKFQTDPHWCDLMLFYEYFHGDNGAGIGASHQTGRTGLVAKLIQQWGEYAAQNKTP